MNDFILFLGAMTFTAICFIFLAVCVASLIALIRKFRKKSNIERLVEKESRK